MAQFRRWSRQEAIDYLNTSANFQELRRHNARIGAPADMSTDLLRRYASGLRRLDVTGQWAHDLAELRGHPASEGHRGRGRKKGMENYTRPERVPRMFYEPMRFATVDRRGQRVTRHAHYTVTAGETVAVRALVKAAREGHVVALTLSGPLPGQQVYMFWQYGWSAKRLLEAAGYRRTRQGNYLKRTDGEGIERFLRRYMTQENFGSKQGEAWPFIALYQIYTAETLREYDLVAEGQQRTWYFRDKYQWHVYGASKR